MTSLVNSGMCKGLSKALSRADSGRDKVIGVIKGKTLKIEVRIESLSVIMRRWGKMDHRLVWWVTGGPSYPKSKFRKFYGNYANSSSFGKVYLLLLVLLLLLVTTQYNTHIYI